MKSKSENKNNLNEPEVPYQNKQLISIFSSFEEMNEADAQSAANINPIKHLKNTTDLIKKLYADELKNPFDKKIKFK